MFNYELKLGDYYADVKVDITVTVKHGITPEDYEKLRAALNTIEEITRSYEPTPVTKDEEKGK